MNIIILEELMVVGSHIDTVPTGGKYDGVSRCVMVWRQQKRLVLLFLVAFYDEEDSMSGSNNNETD